MELIVEHIKKSYKNKTVLRDISFKAVGGEMIAIIGANGCGKTTLLSILVGTLRADAGTISIDGKNQSTCSGRRAKSIGYVPQINPLPDTLSVKECLKLWCADKTAYNRVLKRYDLKEIERKRINQLSGGMKRRVAIACAMASSPRILIMDEPTAALDITYKKLIHDDMNKFVQDGGLLIMVTHEADEISMCTDCCMIENGVLKKYVPNA